MQAYSPIGSSGTTYVKTSVLNQPVIKELADKHQKSPAQIALRWGLQRGHSVIPKSTNKERLKSNLDIFDFSLSDEDMRKIDEIEQVCANANLVTSKVLKMRVTNIDAAMRSRYCRKC